ncbi:glycoside hydrolase family 18 protein [Atractiella rhizophila]|nr:glycoside hydrolase family 18 protein [Atractiella rhizophila]
MNLLNIAASLLLLGAANAAPMFQLDLQDQPPPASVQTTQPNVATINETATALEVAQVSALSVPAAPHFVIYVDSYWSNGGAPPPVSDLGQWNIIALAFWLTNGPADQAAAWTNLDASTRTSILDSYHAAGKKLIVSAFGQTSHPTTDGFDPTTLANQLAAFVKQWNFDGVDVDYEDLNAMNIGIAEDWLITFQKQLRGQLGDDYIISHAPVGPWFTTSTPNAGTAFYPGGGYWRVRNEVGFMIDWYNIQYYNQDVGYTSCSQLIHTSGGWEPGTSILELNARGIPMEKLVLGKPSTPANAGSGYMTAAQLQPCVQDARNNGWNGGLMLWQYPYEPSWIANVWGN